VVWSVSQAAPLRRMVVDGDLVLGTAADTQGSGGYVSGVKVLGQLNFTMQVRDSRLSLYNIQCSEILRPDTVVLSLC